MFIISVILIIQANIVNNTVVISLTLIFLTFIKNLKLLTKIKLEILHHSSHNDYKKSSGP